MERNTRVDRIEILEVFLDFAPVAWPVAAERTTRAFLIVWLDRRVVWTAWERLVAGELPESARKRVLAAAAWPIWQLRHALPREVARIPPSRTSVVVCTRDRTEDLARCLDSIDQNAPDALEVIVVDSAPSDERTRVLVASRPHLRYVHDRRPGLSIARNTGIAAARGAVIAFTDDDAVVEPRWLEELLQPFNDPTVSVVTGLGLPLEMNSPSQEWFERLSSFIKGYERKEFSAPLTSPLSVGNAGAGVNMAVRRDALVEIGLFDETFGPGTPAKAGDDHEFFYRAIRAGHRIVYEPRAIIRHCHRRDWAALERAAHSYGTAVYAWWCHAIVEERDFSAVRAACWWFLHNEIRNLARSVLRRPGSAPIDLSVASVRGALGAPAAYVRSRRTMVKLGGRRAGDVAVPGDGEPVKRPPPTTVASRTTLDDREGVDVSVIVATHNRRTVLLETLDALAEQSIPEGSFEIVVSADSCTDGTRDAVEARASSWPIRVRVVEHTGAKASATRNLGAAAARGSWLVFLDDDIRPAPGFLAAHSSERCHQTVNLGYARPIKTPDGDHVNREAWRWWEDQFRRGLAEPGHRFRYTDFLSGNFGIDAGLFRDVGGFDETFTRAGWEDYEFGLRLIERGVRFAYLADAVGDHAFGSDLRSALARRRLEGRAAVLLGRLHPHMRFGLFADFLPDDLPKRTRRVLRLARAGSAGERLAQAMTRYCDSEKKAGRNRRIRLSTLVRDVRYWQGVIDETGSIEALSSWLQDSELPASLSVEAPSVDIAVVSSLPPETLIENVAHGADRHGVRVLTHGRQILAIAPEPGAERLRALHVLAAAQREQFRNFTSAGVLPTRPEPVAAT